MLPAIPTPSFHTLNDPPNVHPSESPLFLSPRLKWEIKVRPWVIRSGPGPLKALGRLFAKKICVAFLT